ncbi:ABC transporter permease [Dyella mobilis]|uniref:ABC transporter permease n=1 Tax=Dyella mobilis TaxID=1849582 RepID=A0ABS2KM86_9GAMM|nr:ABC transporter permease [Dyella mobilis]MBM7132270.1 ABC transporter permease [Dyella mobilis]GLQ95745.1 ABC transporter ATP-binding protein [Dyella mobilis]
MFAYYFQLALLSLRKSPGLTALMVLAIAVGVASSMTTYAVFRAVAGDPIPWKSSKLFVPQLDMFGPKAHLNSSEPPDAMDYLDAMQLMRDHRATLQSAMYEISPSIVPSDARAHPVNVDGHAVYSEFFPMLDVPFKYGSGWTAQDDAQHAAVAVISSKLNEKLFGGANSVGRTLNIEGKDYRVIGVLDNWDPQPRFYDVVNNGGGFDSNSHDLFLPFTRSIDAGITNQGSINCAQPPAETGFVGLQHSSCAWIAYMVELDNKDAVASYHEYLYHYSALQQQAGRFGWAPNIRLRNVPEWLDFEQVVPPDTKLSLVIALGLMAVCLANTIGLLLAKFMRRSGEIGLRRALGAPRTAIYAQFITEAGIIGAAGGVLGLLLTIVGVACVGKVLPTDIAGLARIDTWLLLYTLLLAVTATILAGLYPALRVAKIHPALQLKSA